MKKLLLLLLFAVSINALAQKNDRQDKIKALKIAFITERLDLTETEAQKFWPIYNTFEKEQHKLRRENRKLNIETINALTEAEAKTQIENMTLIEVKRHQLRKNFIDDLLKVLPAKK